MKLLFVVNIDWFFLSHRLPIALEAKARGYQVIICAIETDKRPILEKYGFSFIPLPATRSGKNVFSEFFVLIFLMNLYRKLKPDIVHHVGLKAVTYGSIAAKIYSIPKVVNALAGLGYLFINKNSNPISHRFVLFLLKFGFNNPNLRIILQNKDDFEEIKNINILEERQMFMIKGSGIDLNEFNYSSPPQFDIIKIVLPARMLWDKGVFEFVMAAERLKLKYSNVNFFLVGPVDPENISSISKEQLFEWQSKGIVSWLGFQSDMKLIYESSHIIVLPSYREGLPKALIEACAIGRPIVTTDVPGCREVVINDFNGLVVKLKDIEALTQSIEKLILNDRMRLEMGKNGRKFAEDNFSITDVISKTFLIYNS